MIYEMDNGAAVAARFDSPEVSQSNAAARAVVYTGDYLNKLTGESVERECRRKIAEGVTELVLNFSKTELVNSIGVSILLGVIDAAKSNGAEIMFADVNESTAELFEMLGLTNHVRLIHGQQEQLALNF